MTVTLRERAEHAAKYGSNLMVPARDIQLLLDQAEKAEARIQAVRAVLDNRTRSAGPDWTVPADHIRCALDGDPQ